MELEEVELEEVKLEEVELEEAERGVIGTCGDEEGGT